MEIVGHSAIEMTMNVYGHVDVDTTVSGCCPRLLGLGDRLFPAAVSDSVTTSKIRVTRRQGRQHPDFRPERTGYQAEP